MFYQRTFSLTKDNNFSQQQVISSLLVYKPYDAIAWELREI